MASPQSRRSYTALLAAIMSVQLLSIFVSGKLDCEDLPMDLCAFAVSSTGSRCVLEKMTRAGGEVAYECQGSTVYTIGGEQFSKDWVESEECMDACGLDRMWVGLSSDAFLDKGFTTHLCSPACHSNCPNIIDLFSNLAVGEGVSLSQLCRSASRREMVEVSFASLSSDATNWIAPAPELSP